MMLSTSKRVVLWLALHLFHGVVLAAQKNPRVLTKQGYVRGIRQTVQTSNGQTKTIHKFLGVPYAKKPIGDLRFKPPQALSIRRSSDYKAISTPPICMQDVNLYFDSVRGAWPDFDPKKDMSEDCLYVNIYTPSTRRTKKYPVIVHIHGGTYVAGTPTRDVSPGEYLPTRDVVLVTIQYRLGTFGFFTTGDSEAPGNVGLLDQVEALKWVRDNIDGFGGDKNSVTLLGESAGGSSVGLHYLSPLSKGLFHRGIAVSGVDLSPFAYKPKSVVLQTSKDLIRNVNCTKASSLQILQCLKSVSSRTVLINSNYWLMQPFVDHHFLPDEPKRMREKGRFHKIPLMSGFVSHEGSFIVEYYLALKDYKISELTTTKAFNYIMQELLLYVYNLTRKEAPVAYNALKFQYTPWDDLKEFTRFRKKASDMWGDCYFNAPTDAALTLHSNHGAPTYMFEFAHRSKYHPKPQWMGAIHEDTTAYKFGLPLLKSKTKLKFDERDRNVSNMVVTMFTNFAKFGNPTPTRVLGLKWHKFDSSKKAYLKINNNPVMTNKYHPMRMAFWNTYFPTLLPQKPLPPTDSRQSVSDKAGKRGKPKPK